MMPRFAVVMSVFLMVFAVASGASAQDAVPISNWDEANRNFVEWQKQVMAQRSQISPELKKVLYKKVVVPFPEAAEPEKLTPVKFEFGRLFGSFGPGIPLFPPVTVEAEIGKPSAYVGVNVRGEALKVLALERKVGVAFSSKDNSVAFKTSVEAKLGFEAGENPVVGAEVGAGFNFLTQQVDSAGGKLGISNGMVGGGIGVNEQGDLVVSGEVGPSFKLGKFASIKTTIEGEVSAPVRITGVKFGSEYGLSSFCSSAAIKITKWLLRPTPCAYCGQRGSLTCPECNDSRYVTCPECSGARQVDCGRCDGSGQLSCSTTESCSSCGGSGQLRCGTCGGRGTQYQEEEYTDWVKVPVEAGFDESGQPYTRYEYQSVTKTRTVSVSCSECGGSGRSGSCGECGGSGQVTCSRCNGSGWVCCGRCNGSGKVNCGECDGSGQVTCPTCGGRPIICTFCSGSGTLEPR